MKSSKKQAAATSSKSSTSSPSPASSTSSKVASAPPTRPRCKHVSRNGRACRYRAWSTLQPFCKYHLPSDSPEAFYATLHRMAQNFDKPDGVTNVLFTIFFALVEDRISARKAGLLTYISQTILHSQRATTFFRKWEREEEADERWNRPYSNDSPSAEASAPQLPANSPEAPAPAGTSSREPAPSLDSQSAAAPLADPPVAPADPKPKPKKPAPSPVVDLNHFYPRDATLPKSLQNPNSLAPPPPSREELDRRRVRFDRIHGIRSSPVTRSYPHEEDPDWKIINGK